MKTLILLFACCLLVCTLFSQAANSPVHTKEYYLQKSRIQKTIGFVVLGAGAVLLIKGLTVGNATVKKPDLNALALSGLGFVGCLVSIPFFASAGKDAHKAAMLSLHDQPILLPQPNGFVAYSQPALTLKVRLGH